MSLSVKTQGGGGGGMYASIFATGVSETDTVTLTTPKGIVKSGKYVRRARLPEEYQEVEYLESSGMQHVITDYYANANTVFKMPMQIDAITYVKSWAQVFGTEGGSGFAIWGDSAKGLRFFTPESSGEINYNFTLGEKIEIEFGAGAVKVDGEIIGTYATGSFTTGNPIAIGGINSRLGGEYPLAHQTIYPIEAVENGSTVHHYIPCYTKATGGAGLYDLVSKTFFGNDGTGEFVVGPDVVHAGFLFEKLCELGTYTLDANDGKKTTHEEVLVDMSAEYHVEVSYILWLYHEGDECEDVTGGWGTDGWTCTESGWGISTSVTKNTDNMYTKAPSNQRYCVGAMTNPVNLTGYSKLCMDVYTGSAAWALELLVTSSKDYRGENGFLYEDKSSATRAVVMADISSINQEAYIAFASGGNNTDRWAYIYNIWLE